MNDFFEAVGGGIGALLLIWAILGDHEQGNDQKLYKPGDLLLYPDRENGGFVVYSPADNYEIVFTGTLEECEVWIQQNTYSGN